MLEYVQLKESLNNAFKGLGKGFTADVKPQKLAGPIDIAEDCITSQQGTVRTGTVPTCQSSFIFHPNPAHYCPQLRTPTS